MMKERLTIIPHHSGGGGFDIPFSNGTISIPDTPGGYCISSGCGCGKTESIKSLIRQKYNDGILYAVDTNVECQKMYEWVQQELVATGIINDADVMMINSQSSIETMNTYYEHPEKICDVKILIVVQVRFFVELINYFLIYRPTIKPDSFNGDFKALMGRTDIRKYICFDETPLFLKPFVSLTKGELSPFATKQAGKWTCKSGAEVKDIYDSFIKGDRKMDYNKKDNTLARTKNAVVLNMLPKMFPYWLNLKGKECHIQFWPSDLVQTGMTSHVLVYEGAGDVLIGSSSKFNLLDLKDKYNSKVLFHQFKFSLNRKKEPEKTEYDVFVKSVANIIKSGSGKTLIVIWKDFKNTGITDIPNDKYTSRLNDSLVIEGISDKDFTVTYYGASDTKSCNSYRDYSNIILCGSWSLGNSVIEKLKKAFICQTTCMENYMMWYYIQLLLRIGIRNNNKGTYHVYYSSDYRETFIERIKIYLNYNILIPKSLVANVPLWEVLVRQYKKGIYYLKNLKSLCMRDPKLRESIETCQSYVYTISLKDIARLIPKRKRPQKDNYRSLSNFLKKIGITLNITK